jgi:nucleotide-binding universal stress UspA family protein
MHKVLIATDGSQHAERALAYLIDLIQQDGACSADTEVHLINVQPRLPSRITQNMTATQLNDYYAAHSANACRAAVESLQQAGIAFTLHTRVGAPGMNIVAAANELQCQSIVMGSHGAGLALGALLGSVASEVIKLSSLPVTLVK